MKAKTRMSLIAAGALVVLGAGAVLYANADNLKKPDVLPIGKMSNSERIARAGSQLERMKGKPEEVSTVLVSFDKLQDKDFVRGLTSKHNLRVDQVYFTIPISEGPTTRGGFVVGDDMEAAFKNHEAMLISSFQTSVESMGRRTADVPQFVVETEKDKAFMQEYEMAKKALGQYEERLAKAKQGSAMYDGVRLEVRNDKALELARTPGIRAVEIITEKVDKKASPMLPEGIKEFTR
jgi:hypothetical protein